MKDAKDDIGKVDYYLAISCIRTGKLGLAKEWLKRASELEPNNPTYRHLQDSLSVH